jgi:hypothetical protein
MQLNSSSAPSLSSPASPPRVNLCCAQALTVTCRQHLTFTPRSLALLGQGCLRSLTLSCGRFGADTLQHLGCLTGLTQLHVNSDGVDDPGDPVGANAYAGAVLRHLTALSGLTQLAHLRVELEDEDGDEDGDEEDELLSAAELLAALPRAPLQKVRPGLQ